MRSYTVRFHIDAPPRKVWRVLHPPVPPNSPRPRVLKWPTGSMEILNEGDEAGEGLGAHLRLRGAQVPAVGRQGTVVGDGDRGEAEQAVALRRGGQAVVVSRRGLSRTRGTARRLRRFSRSTRRIYAYNPVLRFLLERPVHAKISRDNLETYEHALALRRPRHATGLGLGFRTHHRPGAAECGGRPP